MGKITCRQQSKNSQQRANDQQEAEFSALPTPTRSSLRFTTSANDGSHVFTPSLCNNNIQRLTICSNTVAVITRDTRKRKRKSQAQDVFSDTDASLTVSASVRSDTDVGREGLAHRLRSTSSNSYSFGLSISRSSKSSISQSSPGRRSPIIRIRSVEGEITGALVTSKYLCSRCDSKIPNLKQKDFSVKCPVCKMNWKCKKVQLTCRAKIVLELSDGQIRRFTLDDSLLRTIVRFRHQGYCDTDRIEKKVLKVGNVRVMSNNGVVWRVTRVVMNKRQKERRALRLF